MSELRKNIISRQWVIIATERARRPHQFTVKKKARNQLPPYVPSCPFCPGNEAETPPETFRLPAAGDWGVRVVPNKFPALTAQAELVRTNIGNKRTISGVGVHEIIIETPDHNNTLALMSDAEVERVIEAYLNRYHCTLADSRIEHATLFKNHGATAGTSIEHPHSQIIATPIIPGEIRERLESALQFYDDSGQCIFCVTLQEEQEEHTRIVHENDHFVAFIPFAALSPFHLWIFPKRHCAGFGSINDAEGAALASILRRVLRKLYDGLGNPDYNFVIRTGPKESDKLRHYHWYVTLIPRVTQTAGFELGSGMFINMALPEESAQFLRGVVVN
jgi:UDPglucose--hexose-1-phosphate uridylyltransferase